MKKYLSVEEYEELVKQLQEIAENKREPYTTYDYAFVIAFDGANRGISFLNLYKELMGSYERADVKDLHAFCLGFGTASMLIDELINKEDDSKKTYH